MTADSDTDYDDRRVAAETCPECGDGPLLHMWHDDFVTCNACDAHVATIVTDASHDAEMGVCKLCDEVIPLDTEQCPECDFSLVGTAGELGLFVGGTMLSFTIIGAIIGLPMMYAAYKNAKLRSEGGLVAPLNVEADDHAETDTGGGFSAGAAGGGGGDRDVQIDIGVDKDTDEIRAQAKGEKIEHTDEDKSSSTGDERQSSTTEWLKGAIQGRHSDNSHIADTDNDGFLTRRRILYGSGIILVATIGNSVGDDSDQSSDGVAEANTTTSPTPTTTTTTTTDQTESRALAAAADSIERLAVEQNIVYDAVAYTEITSGPEFIQNDPRAVRLDYQTLETDPGDMAEQIGELLAVYVYHIREDYELSTLYAVVYHPNRLDRAVGDWYCLREWAEDYNSGYLTEREIFEEVRQTIRRF